MGRFADTVTLADGRVLYVPSDASNAVLFDPTTNAFETVDDDLGTSEQKFSRGLVLPDGRVVFVPDRADDLFVYDENLALARARDDGKFFANTPTTDGVTVAAATEDQTTYTWTPPEWADEADVLVVAGGGGGGGSDGPSASGAGGGAGGLVFSENVSLSSAAQTVVVGRGGTGVGASSDTAGQSGFDSSAFGVAAIGGGGGGARNQSSNAPAKDGGSGGGEGSHFGPGTDFGSGEAGQGNDGGSSGYTGSTSRDNASGGGGGAGSVGGDGQDNAFGGDGGEGKTYASVFTTQYGDAGWFAGGGGGGISNYFDSNRTPGSGGQGGGGTGGLGASSSTTTAAESGMAHTGGGGGGVGARGHGSGNGGSGIVLVKLKSSAQTHDPVIYAFHHGPTESFTAFPVRPSEFDGEPRLYSDGVVLADGTVLLLPFTTGRLVRWDPNDESFELLAHPPMSSPDLRGILLPDGTVFLASRQERQRVYRWDPRDPSSIEEGPVWEDGVVDLVLDESGYVMAVSASTPARILRWSLQTGPVDASFVRYVS